MAPPYDAVYINAIFRIDGFVQDRSNSRVLSMESL